jgi:2-methylcitrate dehydratase PrpD
MRSHAGVNFGKARLDELTAGLGERWIIQEVAIKPFPVCHILHACADSALALRRKHHLQPADIREVRALLHPESFHYVAEPPSLRRRPPTDYVAKFSVHYVVATCLVRGRFGFAELEPDALADPETLALAERVSHDVDPQSAFPRYFSGGVVIKTADGRELVHMERINRGAGDRQLTADEICDKFNENASLAVSDSRVEDIRSAVLQAEHTSARELMRIVSGR